MAGWGVKIRERVYLTGRKKFVLDCGFVNGRRVQLAFDSHKLAEEELRARLRIRRDEGRLGHELSPKQRARFALAERELQAAGLSIEEAVKIALNHGSAIVRKVTMGQLVEEFIGSRLARGASRRYVAQLGVSLGSFAAERMETAAGDVSREDVKAWLFGHGWKAKTIRNYAGDLRAMFNFAVREKLVVQNPAGGIELPRARADAEISVLSPAQCARLLAVCRDARGPVWHPGGLSWRGEAFRFDELLGYVAVTMFCGVRPEEVRRSTRADMDLANRTFVVGGAVAKDARRRVVDLSPAAVSWLALWCERRPGQRAFRPANWRKKWERLRREAGLWPWPADVLRHTFATMHFAAHQNLALLKAQMGHHEGEATLHRHYRAVRMQDGGAVSPQIAKKFWGLRA